MSRGMYFRHIRWCICSESTCRCLPWQRGGGERILVRIPSGSRWDFRRRAKSAMILAQCGICFQEFLLPAKRQEIRWTYQGGMDNGLYNDFSGKKSVI